ncbi:MAG: hypothetical protein WKF58_14165 [Ilumatobacteraceae bacterium]
MRRLLDHVDRAGIALLALLAYVPTLLSSPGTMPADTKAYLYLDPGRLTTDAPWTFDPASSPAGCPISTSPTSGRRVPGTGSGTRSGRRTGSPIVSGSAPSS